MNIRDRLKPRTKETISVSVNQDLLLEIELIIEKLKCSRSQLVTTAIEDLVDKFKKDYKKAV